MVFKRQAEDYKLVATKTTTSARQNQRAHLSATLTKRFLGKWGMSNVLNPNEIEIDERRTERLGQKRVQRPECAPRTFVSCQVTQSLGKDAAKDAHVQLSSLQ